LKNYSFTAAGTVFDHRFSLTPESYLGKSHLNVRERCEEEPVAVGASGPGNGNLAASARGMAAIANRNTKGGSEKGEPETV